MPEAPGQDRADSHVGENSQRLSSSGDAPLPLRVLENGRVVYEGYLIDVLEVGRQRAGEPGRYNYRPAMAGSPPRLIIADAEEATISRQHLSFQRLPCDVIRVTNHGRVAVPVQSGGAVLVQQTVALDTPVAFSLEARVILIGHVDSGADSDAEAFGQETLRLDARGLPAGFVPPARALAPDQGPEVQNARKTLLRQLRLRFGEPPPEVTVAIIACDDLARLNAWLDRFATAHSLADLGIMPPA